MKKIYQWDNQHNAHVIWQRMTEVSLAYILRTIDPANSTTFKHALMKSWFNLDNSECIKVMDWLKTTPSWLTDFELAILFNNANLQDKFIKAKLKRNFVNPYTFLAHEKRIKAPTLDVTILNKIAKNIIYVDWLKLDFKFFWKAKLTP